MCSRNHSDVYDANYVTCDDHDVREEVGDDIYNDFLSILTTPPGEAEDYLTIDHDACEGISFPYLDYTQVDSVKHAFVGLYIITIFFSLVGNYMVIYTVWKKKHMRTITNYYILNLSIADFLIALFVMPLKLLEYAAPCSWNIFNRQALCPFLTYISPVFVFTSVLTLVAISLERLVVYFTVELHTSCLNLGPLSMYSVR